MNKIVIVVALIALSLGSFSCGGGGAGGPLVPPGENPGIPSVVQLLPSTFIAQTNSSITLNTKVLDGNGIPLANIPVTFTNLSHPFGTLSATVKNTDSSGIATVTLYSTTPGFATILAQVNSGVGQVRDRKSVFFSTKDVLAVTMRLDVDSVPGNGNSLTFVGYDEPSDFILFEPPPTPDDSVEVLATVFDAGGVSVGGGMGVSWSSSHTEAGFVRTETATNVNGQAKAVVKVTPISIRDTETHVNIMASADNGAANMVTLFLRHVIVSSVTVTAKPTIVDTGGTSTITAIVMLNTGSPAPTGTSVSFTATCGTVIPFAQTDSNGMATSTYTAPSVVPAGNICTVTATVGGKSGSVDITIKSKLTLMPSSVTLHAGASQTYTITGGVAPYSAFSSDPTNAPVSPVTTSAPFTFTLGPIVGGIGGICTYDPGPPIVPCTATVTITVQDATGATATATVNVINP